MILSIQISLNTHMGFAPSLLSLHPSALSLFWCDNMYFVFVVVCCGILQTYLVPREAAGASNKTPNPKILENERAAIALGLFQT